MHSISTYNTEIMKTEPIGLDQSITQGIKGAIIATVRAFSSWKLNSILNQSESYQGKREIAGII